MNDYLSEYLQDNRQLDEKLHDKVYHSKEAKNVKSTCRYLELEGPGVHEFLQYSHFYKAKLGSGKLLLIFTDDVVELDGTQSLLLGIATEVSLHTIPLVRALDPTHANVNGTKEFVSKISVQTRGRGREHD